ncbi:hypothetical protein C8F01DRAFT_1088873 [Mycena amicta]|nr:hypothetical protein C8F01DRAFT_1088873 [Mycena amicta]
MRVCHEHDEFMVEQLKKQLSEDDDQERPRKKIKTGHTSQIEPPSVSRSNPPRLATTSEARAAHQIRRSGEFSRILHRCKLENLFDSLQTIEQANGSQHCYDASHSTLSTFLPSFIMPKEAKPRKKASKPLQLKEYKRENGKSYAYIHNPWPYASTAQQSAPNTLLWVCCMVQDLCGVHLDQSSMLLFHKSTTRDVVIEFEAQDGDVTIVDRIIGGHDPREFMTEPSQNDNLELSVIYHYDFKRFNHPERVGWTEYPAQKINFAAVNAIPVKRGGLYPPPLAVEARLQTREKVLKLPKALCVSLEPVAGPSGQSEQDSFDLLNPKMSSSDIPSFQLTATHQDHRTAINSVVFCSQEPNLLATSSEDGGLTVYRRVGVTLRKTSQFSFDNGVRAVVWVGPHEVIAGLANGQCWDLPMVLPSWPKTKRKHTEFPVRELSAPITCVDFQPTTKLVAIGYARRAKLLSERPPVWLEDEHVGSPLEDDVVFDIKFHGEQLIIGWMAWGVSSSFCSSALSSLLVVRTTFSGLLWADLSGQFKSRTPPLSPGEKQSFLLPIVFIGADMVAAATSMNRIAVYEVDRNEPLFVLKDSKVTSCQMLVAGASDGRLYVWVESSKKTGVLMAMLPWLIAGVLLTSNAAIATTYVSKLDQASEPLPEPSPPPRFTWFQQIANLQALAVGGLIGVVATRAWVGSARNAPSASQPPAAETAQPPAVETAQPAAGTEDINGSDTQQAAQEAQGGDQDEVTTEWQGHRKDTLDPEGARDGQPGRASSDPTSPATRASSATPQSHAHNPPRLARHLPTSPNLLPPACCSRDLYHALTHLSSIPETLQGI